MVQGTIILVWPKLMARATKLNLMGSKEARSPNRSLRKYQSQTMKFGYCAKGLSVNIEESDQLHLNVYLYIYIMTNIL